MFNHDHWTYIINVHWDTGTGFTGGLGVWTSTTAVNGGSVHGPWTLVHTVHWTGDAEDDQILLSELGAVFTTYNDWQGPAQVRGDLGIGSPSLQGFSTEGAMTAAAGDPVHDPTAGESASFYWYQTFVYRHTPGMVVTARFDTWP